MRLRSVVCAAGSLLAASALASAQDSIGAAQAHFLTGRGLFERGSYEPALAEFRASLALYDSPNSRIYVARSLHAIGRVVEAVEEFERAAHDADARAASDPRYAAAGDAAVEELREIAPLVGHVTLVVPRVPAGTHVRVTSREVALTSVGRSLPVQPGRVDIEAQVPGAAPVLRAVEVAAGQTVTVTLLLEPAPGSPSDASSPAAAQPGGAAAGALHVRSGATTGSSGGALRATGAVGLGLGGAGLAAALAFGLLSNQQYADLSAHCTNGCDVDPGPLVARGQAYDTVTNVSFAAGLGTAALGGVLFLVGALRPGPVRARPSARAPLALEVAF